MDDHPPAHAPARKPGERYRGSNQGGISERACNARQPSNPPQTCSLCILYHALNSPHPGAYAATWLVFRVAKLPSPSVDCISPNAHNPHHHRRPSFILAALQLDKREWNCSRRLPTIVQQLQHMQASAAVVCLHASGE